VRQCTKHHQVLLGYISEVLHGQLWQCTKRDQVLLGYISEVLHNQVWQCTKHHQVLLGYISEVLHTIGRQTRSGVKIIEKRDSAPLLKQFDEQFCFASCFVRQRRCNFISCIAKHAERQMQASKFARSVHLQDCLPST